MFKQQLDMKSISKYLIFIGLIVSFFACNREICPANNGGHIELMKQIKSQHPAINMASANIKDDEHLVN